MSIKANFFKIGLFVIFTFTLLMVGVVFWGADTFNQKKYYAETYSAESVQGLTVGSPVYYLGVQIGEVAQIAVMSAIYDLPEGSEDWEKFSGNVYVRMSLHHERLLARSDPNEFIEKLVARGFRLRITANPLTGIAFLEANYLDPNEHPPMELPWEPTYVYIPSEPSIISEFLSGIEKTMKRLDGMDIEGLIDGAKKTLSSMEIGRASCRERV